MEIIASSEEEFRIHVQTLSREKIFVGGPRKTARVVALFGELGAGKTMFTKFLAEEFGVHAGVKSPTFIIERIYDIQGHEEYDRLIHIDAYRLRGPEDLFAIGWADIINEPRNIIVIEWAGIVRELLPEDAIHITINVIDEKTREIVTSD